MIYHVALHMSCQHLFTAPLPFAFPQYTGAPTGVQRGGQEPSQEKQCHCYSPLPGRADTLCAGCSLSKAGINAGYPVINTTQAALVVLQVFILHIYCDCCLLMISDEILIYRGERPFLETFMADQHYL